MTPDAATLYAELTKHRRVSYTRLKHLVGDDPDRVLNALDELSSRKIAERRTTKTMMGGISTHWYLVIVLAIASLPAVEIAGVDYSQGDKRDHFKAGVVVAMAAILTDEVIRDPTPLERFLVGSIAATVVGIGKELYDRQGHGTQEVADAVATATGGLAVSAVFCWEF